MITANEISVIMPVYNGAKYLMDAIKSVQNQSIEGNCELIIIDDGSTDYSLEIARQQNAIVLTQDHKHAAAARNLGIRNATKDWIFFMDADDILIEDAFSVFSQTFAENGNVKGIFSKIEAFVTPELTEDDKSGLNPRSGPYGGSIAGATFVKREIFEQIGYFDESLSSGEGVEWLLRLRTSNLPTVAIDRTTLKRRLHLTNTGRIARKQEAQNIAAVLRKMRKKS